MVISEKCHNCGKNLVAVEFSSSWRLQCHNSDCRFHHEKVRSIPKFGKSELALISSAVEQERKVEKIKNKGKNKVNSTTETPNRPRKRR